ncbi:MAG: TlpA family protein disulfide reductase [Rikenellaceae bacterium]|jgi:thiol-disulfide isomerase/thioredoxin|nr:TlpA family protein disulfide reductase [Rikenellaceae bacterium]
MKLLPVFAALSTFALVLGSCADDSRPRTVDRPMHGLRNTATLEIDRVELTDTSTVLCFDAYFRPHWWIRIASDTYLRAKGEKLTLTSAEGVVPDSNLWMPASGEAHFRLTFPPLPRGTKTFDFIESDCDDCFKIWDVDLTGRTKPHKSLLPASLATDVRDADKPLPEPELKTGRTTLTVRLMGLREGYVAPVRLWTNNYLTGNRDEMEAAPDAEGRCVFEFDQYGTTVGTVMVGHNVHITPVILAPGEKAEVLVDMRAMSLLAARLHRQADLPLFAFKGRFAGLNRSLAQAYRKANPASGEEGDPKYDFGLDFNKLSTDTTICDKSAEEFLALARSLYDEKMALIEASDLPVATKQVFQADLRCAVAGMAGSMNRLYAHLYLLRNNGDRSKLAGATLPEVGEKELLALGFADPGDPRLAYSQEFYYLSEFFKPLSDEALVRLTGSETGLLNDLRKVKPACVKASAGEEPTAGEKSALASVSNPFYGEAYALMADRARKMLEEAARAGGYEIAPTPEVEAAAILDAIVAAHKGKPLFVDFWATWCGPCLQAMKTMRPLKSEMKEHGVSVVYISYEGSPKTKWLPMLPEIGGVHYYLTDGQWGVLRDKYDVNGIPQYMIFDRDGHKTFQCAGFPGVEAMRSHLEKVW